MLDGDLRSFLHKEKETIPKTYLYKMSTDVAAAMSYLSEEGCIHRLYNGLLFVQIKIYIYI